MAYVFSVIFEKHESLLAYVWYIFMYWYSGGEIPYDTIFLFCFLVYTHSFFWCSWRLTLRQWPSMSTYFAIGMVAADICWWSSTHIWDCFVSLLGVSIRGSERPSKWWSDILLWYCWGAGVKFAELLLEARVCLLLPCMNWHLCP